MSVDGKLFKIYKVIASGTSILKNYQILENTDDGIKLLISPEFGKLYPNNLHRMRGYLPCLQNKLISIEIS